MWTMLNLSPSHQGPPGQHGPRGSPGPIGGEVSVIMFFLLSVTPLRRRGLVRDSRLALISGCAVLKRPSTAES